MQGLRSMPDSIDLSFIVDLTDQIRLWNSEQKCQIFRTNQKPTSGAHPERNNYINIIASYVYILIIKIMNIDTAIIFTHFIEGVTMSFKFSYKEIKCKRWWVLCFYGNKYEKAPGDQMLKVAIPYDYKKEGGQR